MTRKPVVRPPGYKAWTSMKGRCNNPNDSNYARYGGRGIYVCDRWNESYAAFIADMGERPSPQHSLDRIDNNGPYSPLNCRWSTSKEQGRNRHDNRIVEWKGKPRLLIELAEKYELPYECVRQRLRMGWTLEKALTYPLRVAMTADDAEQIRVRSAEGASNQELAREYGVTPKHISRIVSGRHWVNAAIWSASQGKHCSGSGRS